jgi:hypothetical protein
MGERTTRFCDDCDKTLEAGKGFQIVGGIVPIGSDDADDTVITEGDFCPTCLGQKLGMTPDVLGEIMSGLDELFGKKPADAPAEEKKPNLVDVLMQSFDDLAEMAEPSAETKQKIKDLGTKVQSNWTAFNADLQAQMKKVFKVDESDPEEPKVTPKNGSSNGSPE